MQEQNSGLVRIFFLRHGEKEIIPGTPDTALTKKGISESMKKGAWFKTGDELRLFTADKERHLRTGALIIENSPIPKKINKGIKEELGFPCSTNFLNEMRAQPSFTEQTRFYLNFADKEPDAETKAPQTIVAELNNLIVEQKQLLTPAKEIVIVNITSDFNISAYLFFTKGIEVAVDYLKGFEILFDGHSTWLIFENSKYLLG